MNVSLRKADTSDIPVIISFIQELATYERAPHEVSITPEDLERDGFGENPIFEVIIAEQNNEPSGMAFYYYSYSTWKGKCIFLEDIIVTEKYRGKGIGKVLFDAVVLKAKETGAKRMQWQVLDWNEPAIHFYKKYHASFDPTWITCRLGPEQIKTFNQ